MTQVYCLFCGVGVAACASNAEWIVVIKTRIKNFLSIKSVEYLRRLFSSGGFQLVCPCPYLAQQWPPEQHLAPQQSARCEVAVAVLIVARAISIIKRYFMKVPPVEFDYISLTA
jgi:hypothetical protein